MMKLDQIDQLHQDIEVVSQMDKFKRYHQIGGETLKPGHRLFSLSLETGDIKAERYDVELIISLKKNPIKRGKLVVDDKHLYKGALNEKNAAKHFEKMLNEIRGTAQHIRSNPLLDIQNFAHWDILKALGFTTFKHNRMVSTALTEKVKHYTPKGEEPKIEEVSICHIIPSENGKFYEVGMVNKRFKLFPFVCRSYELLYLIQTAFLEFNNMLVKGKEQKKFDARYVNAFGKKNLWLMNATEEELHIDNSLKFIQDHVNQAK
jgi:hypothetical protein